MKKFLFPEVGSLIKYNYRVAGNTHGIVLAILPRKGRPKVKYLFDNRIVIGDLLERDWQVENVELE